MRLLAACVWLVGGLIGLCADPPHDAGARGALAAAIDAPARAGVRAARAITYTNFLPVIGKLRDCAPVGETYGAVTILSAPTNPPAETHPDINLTLRGFVPTTGTLGLIPGINPVDTSAPQLAGLFGDQRVPTFTAVYQVYDWDWANNRRGALLITPTVTLAGMGVAPGEVIRVPASGYDIGLRPTGYEVMVLYATATRLTLKYTREDNVVFGYTLHLENICVDPYLLGAYQTLNAAGRAQLPALTAGQGVGRALTTTLGVAIRDTGTFMDPRWRDDWWQGR